MWFETVNKFYLLLRVLIIFFCGLRLFSIIWSWVPKVIFAGSPEIVRKSEGKAIGCTSLQGIVYAGGGGPGWYRRGQNWERKKNKPCLLGPFKKNNFCPKSLPPAVLVLVLVQHMDF